MSVTNPPLPSRYLLQQVFWDMAMNNTPKMKQLLFALSYTPQMSLTLPQVRNHLDSGPSVQWVNHTLTLNRTLEPEAAAKYSLSFPLTLYLTLVIVNMSESVLTSLRLYGIFFLFNDWNDEEQNNICCLKKYWSRLLCDFSIWGHQSDFYVELVVRQTMHFSTWTSIENCACFLQRFKS